MFPWLCAKIKGWRTIIINATVGCPALLFYLYTEFVTVDFTPLIPAKYVALFTVGLAVLGVILRIITTSPVGDPKSVKASD